MAVYSVSQVTSYLRRLLERDPFSRDFWVSGEVSNLTRSAVGHSYFSLRESDSVLRCVMFRDSVGAEHLAAGAAVVAHGRATLYEPRGDLQMVADVVRPEGVGGLQLELERLKLKLGKEGLFETSRKRPLPEFPRRIGVVTSPTGAVWHDVATVVDRRWPMLELLLAPSPVQGDGAEEGIVDALDRLNRIDDLDAVILARGGGSLEDLWPFNSERVARAVYASRSPVVSAVGHETDFTIADMVADRRAATPSAAAAMATPDVREVTHRLLAAQRSLASRVRRHHSTRLEAVRGAARRLGRGLPDLDSHRIRIDYLMRDALARLKLHAEVKSQQYKGLSQRLEALSPRDTMRRGYAVVQRGAGGPIVTDAAQVAPRDALRITLERGALESEVVSTEPGDGRPGEAVR